MAEEFNFSADSGADGAAVESQSTGDDGQEGLDLSNPAGDGAQTAEKDNLTKGMSKRINEIRSKEVEPLKTRIAELESENARRQEIEYEVRAFREGKSVEQVKAEAADQARRRRELIESDPEVKRLKRVEFDHQYNEVMGKIRDACPNDNITKLEDLHQDFFKLLMTGIDPVKAYRIVRDEQQGIQQAKKELPGSVKTEGRVIDKDNYTDAEINRFTREDYLRNPGLMEKVKRSLTRRK